MWYNQTVAHESVPKLQFGIVRKFLPSYFHTQPGAPVGSNEKIYAQCVSSSKGNVMA
jgi:hypothetical protein